MHSNKYIQNQNIGIKVFSLNLRNKIKYEKSLLKI